MKPNNLSLLLDLLQKITGVEADEDPMKMIRKGVMELKKNKRLDPDLFRKMKKSKIFDQEVLDGKKKIGDEPKEVEESEDDSEKGLTEDVRDEKNQENIDNVTIQNDTVAPSLFAPEVKLADPEELYPLYPREGWWRWVISKALVNEPTTRTWYEIAMRELGQFKDNVWKKYRAFQQQNRISMAESEENGWTAEVPDEDETVLWTDKDREEYTDIIKDLSDTDFDRANGIDYDAIDGFLSDKAISDLEDEMYGSEYLSPAEIADIDKEIDSMSDEDLERMAAQYDFEESAITDSPLLQEALTRAQRLKHKLMMKRIKAKIAIGRKRKARRMHTLPELMILARRKAELMLKMKFSHMSASQYREAPVAVKQRIEDRVKSKQSLINRLAKKILPKLRIADKEKLARRAEKK